MQMMDARFWEPVVPALSAMLEPQGHLDEAQDCSAGFWLSAQHEE